MARARVSAAADWPSSLSRLAMVTAVDKSVAENRCWVSAHIYYHGNLDALLIRLIDPLIEQLRARDRGIGAFFIRYWEGGRHLRLRVHCRANDVSDVKRTLESESYGYFARWPSGTEITPAEYEHSAPRLAAIEGLRPKPGVQAPITSM